MQAASTRAVTFEMCGNDGLQARTAFKKQTGTCNYSGMDAAVASCKTYVAAAMDYINANAYAGVKVKVISTCITRVTLPTTCRAPARTPPPAPRSTCATSSCPSWLR